MTASEEQKRDSSSDSPGPHASPEQHSRETAVRLRAAVAELASRLRPFPPFYGMSTLRAIELDLPPGSAVQPPPELGCVVVLPDGEISELDLRSIPGPDGPADIDQVEEFTELDLPPEQYIAFATVAVQLLQAEIERRSED
ncbi:MAG: hypothetical protein DSY79_03005 [Chloroflexi bacterium]|nr:hypothetical protein [Dehalococcoidia bacterium]PKB82519.1 MAG: hypothetical protein BZY84_03365 [SAR202 cluster bacterium MP-SInd-SRR3963457-G1]PKB85660.1 MAG: hypothetical protein BZY86_01465 [SAR202 cluster bacterium MP-NPac-SRR3961935-G1]RUA22782.1 MAG: hypothetical protein DSY79_03005 [Chloroflexota bacterium]PCJ74101.1 MAG: hypothetical protein COA56_13225 [Dehalococcoidia bacterium]